MKLRLSRQLRFSLRVSSPSDLSWPRVAPEAKRLILRLRSRRRRRPHSAADSMRKSQTTLNARLSPQSRQLPFPQVRLLLQLPAHAAKSTGPRLYLPLRALVELRSLVFVAPQTAITHHTIRSLPTTMKYRRSLSEPEPHPRLRQVRHHLFCERFRLPNRQLRIQFRNDPL